MPATLHAREADLLAQYRSARALAHSAAAMKRARAFGDLERTQIELERELDDVRRAMRQEA